MFSTCVIVIKGPIYIKKLVPGGSALLSGQLQVNDIILQVNNKNVDQMSYRVRILVSMTFVLKDTIEQQEKQWLIKHRSIVLFSPLHSLLSHCKHTRLLWCRDKKPSWYSGNIEKWWLTTLYFYNLWRRHLLG